MYKCIANREFKDKYTGDLIVAGATLELAGERVKEIKEVDKTLIDVLGEIVAEVNFSVGKTKTTEDAETVVEETKPPKKQTKKTTK